MAHVQDLWEKTVDGHRVRTVRYAKVTLADFAERRLAAQTFTESSREAAELRLRLHAASHLGQRELRSIKPSRANGMHALRHCYASVLIDAGESVRAVADYLGHSDPGFTLRVYAHLFPSSEDRARHAVDRLFANDIAIGVAQ